jgi:hypothetical protein
VFEHWRVSFFSYTREIGGMQRKNGENRMDLAMLQLMIVNRAL